MNTGEWLGKDPRDWLVEAATRIRGKVHRTPVMTCRSLDERSGLRLFFKTENLQRGGSFKVRGAVNVVHSLPGAQAEKGVLTHSSGNFAQGLALAARERGIPAYIVIPGNAPSCKVEATRAYGAELRICGASVAARERAAAEWREETGTTFVHPYDDPLVIAGQGTAAMELLEEVPDLDVLVAPVGGGGLCGGTTLAGRAFGKPGIRILGVEPRGADDAFRSLRDGVLYPQEDPRTVADGLRTGLGRHPFALFRDFGTELRLVEEEDILEAMELIQDRMKLVVEPSGAVALAGVLEGEGLPRGAKVGVLLSGGNRA